MKKTNTPKGTPEIGQTVDVMPVDSKPSHYKTSWVAATKGVRGKFVYLRIK